MIRVATFALLALPIAAGCRGEEARQIVGAVESFVEFGMSNEERPAPASTRPRPPPHSHERSRSVEPGGRGGPTLRVELDLPHDLPGHQVEAVLSAELDRVLGERRYPRVAVRALPAGLLRFAGTMGTAEGELGRAGPDGGGSRVVRVLIDEQAPALSSEQHRALVALELALASAGAGARPEREARARVEAAHGAETVRDAILAARRRFPERGRSSSRGPR